MGMHPYRQSEGESIYELEAYVLRQKELIGNIPVKIVNVLDDLLCQWQWHGRWHDVQIDILTTSRQVST